MLASSGASALWFSGRLAAAEGVKKLSFIVLSDTHLGRNDDLRSEKQLTQAIAEINELPAKFVLHLGDVVDGGREAQYPVYARLKKTLNKPIHEIPGNHDPVDLFRKHVAEEIDRHVDYGGVRFVMFNNSHRESHDGFITPAQIKWLKKRCDEASQKGLRIVICCHVPVHSNTHPDRGWYVKPKNGQAAFYEVLREHSGRVLACLHGHFHNGIRGWRDNGTTIEVLCPSVCYNQNRNLTEHLKTGKATGFFVDELRAGYVLVELGEGRLTMKYKPLRQEINGQYTAEWSNAK